MGYNNNGPCFPGVKVTRLHWHELYDWIGEPIVLRLGLESYPGRVMPIDNIPIQRPS